VSAGGRKGEAVARRCGASAVAHNDGRCAAPEATEPGGQVADPEGGGGQLRTTALACIAVGVVVERYKSRSGWANFLWRPVSVFVGSPSAAPWTPLGTETHSETIAFYAGKAVVELHRTETANYRDNLASGSPALWVVLRLTASGASYELAAVTADPAEGEGFTDAGNNLVDQVPMPGELAEIVRQFVAEHHVDRPFIKRKHDSQALARGMEGTSSD
jgi:hypothetical protein